MTSGERAKVLRWLEESRQDFLVAIDGLTEEQWNWKPEADRWSVGETAEHIVTSEAGLFLAVQKALASGADPHWKRRTMGKSAILRTVLPARVGRAKAPAVLLPGGGMTAVQIRDRFEEHRVKLLRFTRETEAALHECTLDNPFFGALNAYQWLIYAPLHTMRHTRQIAAIKAAGEYPR